MFLKALIHFPVSLWERAPTCRPAPNLRPQAEVNLQRYLGRWYEQARYDHFFEKGLDEVQADYALDASGALWVVNQGHDARGRLHRARGKAFVPDATAPGSMRVSFVPPYGWFRTPYLILLTDEERYALVSGAGGRYLWLLTREPHPQPEILNLLMAEAARRGFNLTRLRRTQQKGGS